MKIVRSVFSVMLLTCLTSCFTPIGGVLTIDASLVGKSPLGAEMSFSDEKNHVFIYKNVFADAENNFVLQFDAFIKSSGGFPDNLIRFIASDKTSIYGLNSEGVKDDEPLIASKLDEDGYSHYILAGYSDFIIEVDSEQPVNIGKLIFWC